MKLRTGLVILAVVGFVGHLAAQAVPSTQKPADDEFLKGAYASDTKDLVAPKVKREIKPRYTPDAMRAKLQGQVRLQVVVGTDGKVDRARVLESLDKATGLDDAALAAAKQWTFEPGTLRGVAVPVAVELRLEFRLH